jgi:Rhodopirellula transposase DDE domain
MQHWADRGRWKGGGRRPLVVTDPTLLTDLRDLVEPATRRDPTAPLLWTAKSLRNLAAGLREQQMRRRRPATRPSGPARCD